MNPGEIHLSRQEARVLSRLRTARANGAAGVHGYTLVLDCCHRFGGRIHGLRQKGFVISKTRVDVNDYIYALEQEPHVIDLTAPERPAPYVIPVAAGEQGKLFT